MNTRRTKRIIRHTFKASFRPKVNYSPTGYRKRYTNTRPLRPNRKFFQKYRRNRLQRVQNALRYNKALRRPGPKKNYNRYSLNGRPTNNRNSNNANNKREIFVKGLPRFVDNKILFNLFKNEGRINQCKILYDNIGFSRGIGKIEFSDFRDALKTINKWNNTSYKGFTLRLEYRKSSNGQKTGNAGNNSKNDGNNKTYGNFSNYVQYNGYSKKYNGNNKNYGNSSDYVQYNGYSKYNGNTYNYNNYRYKRYY